MLRLMDCRRSEPLPLSLVKATLLLRPTPASPIHALSSLPFYYPRLVSSCAITFCAFCVWSLRGVLSLPRAAVNSLRSGE